MTSLSQEAFLLKGAQIELTNRIAKNKRNLHSNRPATAIPLLLKYKRDSSRDTLSYRPLSADNNRCKTAENWTSNIRNCGTQSQENYKELFGSANSNNSITSAGSTIDKQFLPSSSLLKSLLCDTISARNPTNIDHLQKTKISVNEIDKTFETYVQNEILKQCLLVPGLKTKPPLPQRSQDIHSHEYSNYVREQNNVLPPVPEVDSDLERIESETIPDTLFVEDEILKLEGMKDENNTKERRSYRNGLGNKDLAKSFDDIYLENFEEECETPLTRQPSMPDKEFWQYSTKNWFEENRKLVNHAKQTEEQTDLFFEHLHKQVELSENLCTELDISTNMIDPDSLDESDSTINENIEDNNTKSKKFALDFLDRFASNQEKFKLLSHAEYAAKKQVAAVKSNQSRQVNNNKNTSAKSPQEKLKKNKQQVIKDNKNHETVPIMPKGILKNARKKCNKDKNIFILNKENNKFTRNMITSRRDEIITNDMDENNSYMSLKNTTSNYLDFLNKIEELEHNEDRNVCRSARRHTPERDGENGRPSDVSTCDDIASMLRLLENEDLKSQKKMESMTEIVNEELSKDSASSSSFQQDTSGTNSNISLVSTNYNDVLSYLDQVDQSCRTDCQPTRQRADFRMQTANTTVNLDKIPRVENLLSRTNIELAQSIVDLSLRLKEKASGICVLQDELSKLRKVIQNNSAEFERLLKQKLKIQKDDYEVMVKRHQKFIDQLICDKKSLNQQCESLISEMKMLEDRYISNIRAVEQRHKVELQKSKEMHAIAEKARREKWMEMKTQKIKEMTAKSIEPEIQTMSRRHQQDLCDLRALHRRELEDLELKSARTTQQKCEALRKQLASERETAITHERALVQNRLEKLVEAEEKSYQEQRRRLNIEHTSRMAEFETKESTILAEKERAVQTIREEFQDRFEAAKRRHLNEIKNIKETTELELEAWKNNFKKQQNVKIAEVEAMLREAMKKERDREIELAIDRLEQEASESRQQMEQAAENRLRRMKEKYEEELKDLEKTEQEYRIKYNEAKTKLLEYEETTTNLNSAIKQMQTQLDETKGLCNALNMERNKIKEQIRSEFENEITSLQNEIKVLRGHKEQELQEVFTRVKISVAKKDEVLEELRQDNAALQDKCVFLENLLEQHRKEYLLNNKTT